MVKIGIEIFSSTVCKSRTRKLFKLVIRRRNYWKYSHRIFGEMFLKIRITYWNLYKFYKTEKPSKVFTLKVWGNYKKISISFISILVLYHHYLFFIVYITERPINVIWSIFSYLEVNFLFIYLFIILFFISINYDFPYLILNFINKYLCPKIIRIECRPSFSSIEDLVKSSMRNVSQN